MYDLFAMVSLLLTVVGIALLVRRMNLWADKPRSGVDKLPSMDMGELTPDHKILVILGGEQKGPYTKDQIMQMVASGLLPETALCWQPGATDWVPVTSAFAANPIPPGVPGMPGEQPPQK